MKRFEDDFEFLGNGSKLIGRDEEKAEIIYRIASGNILLIEGVKGVGKTALLKCAIDNFKGLGKVAYIDVKTFGRRLDISRLLKGRSGGMILLIDNIEYLSESNNKKIKYFYDQDYVRSVIFTTANSKRIHFTDAIKSRLGRNILKLKALGKSGVLEIARDRLGDKVFSDDVLNGLYKESKDLKSFLRNLDLLCGYLDETGKEDVELSDIKKIMEKAPLDVPQNSGFWGKIDTEICLECNSKLVEVCGHWRCKNCDGYCDVCGVLTDDDFCPACGDEILLSKDDSGEPEVDDE